jgi:hypothetical protein
MILGLDTHLSFWQFLLLLVVFIAVLALAYYLLNNLLRQEAKHPGKNWNLVGVLAFLLPPILGVGAILGISMFGVFVNQLHAMQQDVQHRVFLRSLRPQERELRVELTSPSGEDGIYRLRNFLGELERRERDWANPELWKAYEQWSQAYLSLLYISGDYQGIVFWDSSRIQRYPNLAMFPATMAVAMEAMGRDGSFWANYVESSDLKGAVVDFMSGYLARTGGQPDSALKYLTLEQYAKDPVDFLSIVILGERARALTDVGQYDKGRTAVIRRLEPLLALSDNPLLHAYVRTTRCYLEMHYYLDQGEQALFTMNLLVENLMDAMEQSPRYSEPRVLIAMYHFLTQDKSKSGYYFNDLRARSPWCLAAISRSMNRMEQTGSTAVTAVHLSFIDNIGLGLRGGS